MDRPFSEASIDELEEVFEEHVGKLPVLAKLKQELNYRSTDRAVQLLKEVKGVLNGSIPVEAPRSEDDADYQMTLDDLLSDQGDDQ